MTGGQTGVWAGLTGGWASGLAGGRVGLASTRTGPPGLGPGLLSGTDGAGTGSPRTSLTGVVAGGRAPLGTGTGPPGLGHDVLTAQAASAPDSLGVGAELDNEPAPEHPGRLVPGDVRRQRTVAAQLRVADDHVRGELASRDQRNSLHDGAVTLTGTTLGTALVAVGPCVQDRVRAVGEHRLWKGQEPRTEPERTLVTWPGRGLGGRRVSCV